MRAMQNAFGMHFFLIRRKIEIFPSSNSVIKLSGQCRLPDSLFNYLRDAPITRISQTENHCWPVFSWCPPLSLCLSRLPLQCTWQPAITQTDEDQLIQIHKSTLFLLFSKGKLHYSYHYWFFLSFLMIMLDHLLVLVKESISVMF